MLAASIYFYTSWNQWLALLICVSTAMDYVVALGMDRSSVAWRRKLLFGTSLVANLSLLCYFKYANFFLASLEQALHAAGAQASAGVGDVAPPEPRARAECRLVDDLVRTDQNGLRHDEPHRFRRLEVDAELEQARRLQVWTRVPERAA